MADRTIEQKLKDFVVILEGKSMTEMGAARYWELHVQAMDETEAIDKSKNATAGWSIYDTEYRIMKDKWMAAPAGSIAYREI